MSATKSVVPTATASMAALPVTGTGSTLGLVVAGVGAVLVGLLLVRMARYRNELS